jgi:unspecific monooxygenase
MLANPPTYLAYDPATRRVRLDPHEPAFVQNPYEAYRWLHGASPAFFWEDFGFWCLGGFDSVNRLLRDRRFGRQNPGGQAASCGFR